MNEELALHYVGAALVFREQFPDALEALSRGQLRPWLIELDDTRLAAFLPVFSRLLAEADDVQLGTRHHMNARAVWRALANGGDIRRNFDRQLSNAIHFEQERGASLQRWQDLVDALRQAGYRLPEGITLGDDQPDDDPFQEFARRVGDFRQAFDLELRNAYSNRYSSLFSTQSPRYEQFINEWLGLMALAHRFEPPTTAPGPVRTAWPKFGPQSELHEKWPAWLQRAADDLRGSFDVAMREDTPASLREKYLRETRQRFSRFDGFLHSLQDHGLADFQLESFNIEDLGAQLENTSGEDDHG